MAAAARSAQQAAADRAGADTAAAARSKAATAKHSSPAPNPTSPAKPKPAADTRHADDSKATAKPGAAGAKANPSSSAQAAANAQSGQDGSAKAADATATNADSNTTTDANGARGRAAARAAAKDTAQATAAADKDGDSIDDPSADSTNQSGLSLLQQLAKSLRRDDSDATSTDTATPVATGKSSADATDKSSDDPNAIALAAFTQALAAALANQPNSGANAASSFKGDATTAIAGASGGSGSMQDLMSVLAHDVAADAKGKSDDGTAQFNVDPTKGDAGSAVGIDTTAGAPGSPAQLGVASHFAAQHLTNDSNTGELKSPVGSSAWRDEVGTQLTWMTQKGLETGSLRVSPEHLGPVEVNISVRNGDASVWFAAHHPDTRAALEQALPRLREMFASQGMNLADSGVSRQPLAQNGSRNQSRSGASQAVSGVSALGGSDNASAVARMSLGLVDTYA